ncbi:transmembrane and coiled-coil domain-containing protein 5B, partial [Biomphalaria glabrata]
TSGKSNITNYLTTGTFIGFCGIKMRPSRQKEIITSHVHDLENVNIKLEVLKDSVTRVKKRAILWLEEKDEASYLQIKQYLLERNSRFLQACIDIASDNDVTDESLREECEEMTSSSQPKVQGEILCDRNT